MVKYREFTYTKTNGEVSERKVLVIANPSKNYLCLDVENLTPDEVIYLQKHLHELNGEKSMLLHKLDTHYKSFKPEGIEWRE